GIRSHETRQVIQRHFHPVGDMRSELKRGADATKLCFLFGGHAAGEFHSSVRHAVAPELLNFTPDLTEHSAGTASNQSYYADHDGNYYDNHHRVFGDILPSFIVP